MYIQKIKINHIPALLYGEKRERLILAVHGNHSSKEDACIRLFAEEAKKRGWQVLAFDLPCHGERLRETEPLLVQNCVQELQTVLAYAKTLAPQLSLFACSMGAYFSLLAFAEEIFEKVWFLSPVTDMERLIQTIMAYSNVTEKALAEKGCIETPIEPLYWSYYQYVKTHPIDHWESPTVILRGEKDTLAEKAFVSAFAERFGCPLTEQPDGEHWFHTTEQLAFFRQWLTENL